MTRTSNTGRLLQLVSCGALAASAILLLKYLQWPANYEIGWYDLMVRSRQAQRWSEQPVLVLGLLDSDNIERPIRDDKLAQILSKLCEAQPRAIGIDLLRDRPVGDEEGFRKLNDVFAACPAIIGVSFFGRHPDQYVSPPDILRSSSRYGFTDVMVDSDKIVRRGFLALDRGRDGGPEQAEFSLALRLARLYLLGEQPPIKITSTPVSSGPDSGVRVGSTLVPRLRSNDGGYVGEEDGGYQFLLDFLEPFSSLEPKPLGAVLDPDFKAATVRGRIVLIGNMTAEAKDQFATPIGLARSDDDQTPGVFLHAYMTRQLIRYGRGESRPMRFLPEWGEALLLLFWGITGAFLGWHGRKRYLGIACLAAVALVFGAAFLLFRAGWWIPPIGLAAVFVPAAIAGKLQTRVRARIFLSYAREDEKRVRRMQQRLQRNGFEAWMDRTNIEPGERWKGAIHDALHEADCFVLCVTARSVSKEGVLHQELKEALDIWRGRLDSDYRIVPARLEDVPLPKELDQFQWVDLWSEKDWDRFVRVLPRRNAHVRR